MMDIWTINVWMMEMVTHLYSVIVFVVLTDLPKMACQDELIKERHFLVEDSKS